jgi:hypothetical protein
MHWYTAILLLFGLVCGLRLHPLLFALLIVSIIVAIAVYDVRNHATTEIALDVIVAGVALQIGYLLGVLGQIVFRHLSPDQRSSSSEER